MLDARGGRSGLGFRFGLVGAPASAPKLVPFERRFPLPPDAEANVIDAALHNGRLEITMPKRAQAGGERRRIDVHGG
jgi:hypothetical protein